MFRLSARQILACLPALLLMLTVSAQAHIYDVNEGKTTSLATMLADLRNVRLVFIGELHDNIGHHQAQLQVIRALHEAGVPVAVGLEMFRQDSQGALDLWTKGSLSKAGFVKIFRQNWGLWPVYRDIFLYARQAGIPLVGLNIRRDITEQVARAGFRSLSVQQRGGLPLVRCDVAPEYQAYIRKVLGNHAHNGAHFRNFCEAQMVWDVVMARTLVEYLGRHPEQTVVVLAGSGHAWKFGIPEQVRRHLDVPFRILLPEIPGRITRENVTPKEADYLLIGTDEGPLH